ncbi:MAG: hypothetical protein II781_01415 [Clostridia bacterium]|nr:hypothetical protein [Clostridia bacterium]
MSASRKKGLPASGSFALPLLLLGAALFYLLYHDLAGGTLFAHNGWDSYTLQADAWLHGRIALDRDYPYLELAIYQGQYYVSFPPFPALLMLPFVLVFGLDTPNNLILAFWMVAALPALYLSFRKIGIREAVSAIASLLFLYGSNLLWMSTCAGVWFIAQVLNFTLLSWALYFFTLHRHALCTSFIALAVGCRPLSVLLLLPVFFLFLREDRQKGRRLGEALLSEWPCILSALLIGLAYMFYNIIRFGNPLEFGHNYLPEFVRAPEGQFSLVYLWPNLKEALFGFISLEPDASLRFSEFGSMAFYLANPVFLAFGAQTVSDLVRRRFQPVQILCWVFLILELLLLCCHRTLGGWQFGCRYTCDLVPYVILYYLLKDRKQSFTALWLFGFAGLIFNLYGALHMLVTQ